MNGSSAGGASTGEASAARFLLSGATNNPNTSWLDYFGLPDDLGAPLALRSTAQHTRQQPATRLAAHPNGRNREPATCRKPRPRPPSRAAATPGEWTIDDVRSTVATMVGTSALLGGGGGVGGGGGGAAEGSDAPPLLPSELRQTITVADFEHYLATVGEPFRFLATHRPNGGGGGGGGEGEALSNGHGGGAAGNGGRAIAADVTERLGASPQSCVSCRSGVERRLFTR